MSTAAIPPINWDRVLQLRHRAQAGEKLSQPELDYLTRAVIVDRRKWRLMDRIVAGIPSHKAHHRPPGSQRP